MSVSVSPSKDVVPSAASPTSQATRQPLLVVGGLVVTCLVVGFFVFRLWNGPSPKATAQHSWQLPSEFQPDRAFSYLEQIVAFGPRPSGSAAMQQQQEFLQQFFEQQGAVVQMQTFSVRHPETGQPVEMKNLIASYRPEAEKRYLLCAHYDTRPFPDQDKADPRGIFVGANDGGSGTAGLMEMSHHIDTLPASIGIDLVLFDGEELVYENDRDPYFLGSEHFAKAYASQQIIVGDRVVTYKAGVLLDMIGDRELQLYYERNSWNYAREVTTGIWATAKRLGITAFQPRIRHLIRDDHLPLNQIAKIPTTDIIDFDYPRPGFRHQSYWHTTEDTLDKLSGQSIAAVIFVVHTWLKNQG